MKAHITTDQLVDDTIFLYKNDDLIAAQNQLESIKSGCFDDREKAPDWFNLNLSSDLTGAQQSTFTSWVASNYPDWNVTWE